MVSVIICPAAMSSDATRPRHSQGAARRRTRPRSLTDQQLNTIRIILISLNKIKYTLARWTNKLTANSMLSSYKPP